MYILIYACLYATPTTVLCVGDVSRPRMVMTTDTPDIWFRGESFTITFSEPIFAVPSSVVTILNASLAGPPVPVTGFNYYRWSFGIITPQNDLVTVFIAEAAIFDESGEDGMFPCLVLLVPLLLPLLLSLLLPLLLRLLLFVVVIIAVYVVVALW
jgi:hypothetical protein